MLYRKKLYLHKVISLFSLNYEVLPCFYRIMVGDERIRPNDTTRFWGKQEKQQYRERFFEGRKILGEIDFNETVINKLSLL